LFLSFACTHGWANGACQPDIPIEKSRHDQGRERDPTLEPLEWSGFIK
jgi:hypothetical protein